MKCFLCKGEMTAGHTTHTVDRGSTLIVIKRVPAMICSQCGEVWFGGTVQRQLEQILHSISSTVATEIAVVNYTEQAA
ncbi:MAG: type II toxin-antitoxin system MqsA family antitoxin [Acidobacteriota bacterium]|jgi:YgiT-type zinc finger domain-containing protein|nr:type II toxin-antitoxin system MqsA family antitoxin [Acidobacteriota bacterium]